MSSKKRSNVTFNGSFDCNILKRKKDKIKIIKLHPHHINTYQTGKDQLVMVSTAAGNNAKFTATVLKDMIKLVKLNHFFISRTIRRFLQRALPKNKYKRSDDAVNA